MDPGIAFIAKEEILRNVFKTHDIVLVLGWPGTGKTAVCLSAAKVCRKIYYFNAAAKSPGVEERINFEGVTFISGAKDLPRVLPAKSLLIVDDLDAATAEVAATVKQLLSGQSNQVKIVITAQTRPKLDEGEFSIDAVVRMKDETAEILYTNLRELI